MKLFFSLLLALAAAASHVVLAQDNGGPESGLNDPAQQDGGQQDGSQDNEQEDDEDQPAEPPPQPEEPLECKCYPGEDCWPSQNDWFTLAGMVEGRLRDEMPPGAVCYPSYEGREVSGVDNSTQCDEVEARWNDATWVSDQSAWPMFPFWSNSTCYPADSPSADARPSKACPATCQQGYLPQYVVRAEKVSDIQAAVNFARDHRLRLIIRNTGHDFMGRSTGYGSLLVNVHRMAKVNVLDQWTGPGSYRGGAVTVDAGVMTRSLYQIVWRRDLDVMAGECPTVGVAGGYVQGGGQGPLSGLYGLAADNALQFTVVAANGQHLTANEEQNPDLFWALKGGGPGAFGVVTSVTMKTFRRVPVTGMALNITGTDDTFWEGFRIWHSFAPELVKNGIYVWYTMSPGQLTAQPFVAPNMTTSQFNDIVEPLFSQLDGANVTYSASYPRQFQSFEDIYNSMWYTAFHGAGVQAVVGGRLISQEDIQTRGPDITRAYRLAVEKFGGRLAFGGHLVNPGNAIADPDGSLSAVHPAWRTAGDVALYLLFLGDCLSQEEKDQALYDITYDIGESIRAVTPKSAVYVNEGDINEPQWKESFWGPVYPRLLQIKDEYDPNGVFWTKATPGSDKWTIVNETKLCKAAAAAE